MGTISRITTFSTGDTLTASDLNGEFDNIISTANGSINADNLGVTAGQASASKAIVLDANKDFANVTTSNQIRNLTISGSLKIGTTFLPDAAGGADLGSTSLEWGDVYVADDKYLYMGSDQNIKIGYDETTTDSLAISAIEGAGLAITLRADEGDDAGDEWKLNVADGGVVTFGNDIASAGTFVTHLTLTPHATVASSTLALAGGLTVAGATQANSTVTVGADDQGYDVKLFGDTASAYLMWDTSADKLLTAGGATIDIVKDKLLIGGVAVTTTAAELNLLDTASAGTVVASKAVVVDSNKDIASFRNVTLTGELDAATGDFSGDVDVDGTLEADAITLGGTALGSLYSPIAGSSSITTVGTVGTGTWQGTAVALAYGGTGLVGATDGKIVIADGSGAPVLLDVGSSTAITVLGTVATGTWQGTAVASAYLDADTAHLSTTQTFSGAKTFSAAAQFSNTVTVGVDDTGYDVKFFGATSGSSLLWDQSADDLILTNAGLAVGSDATGDVYYRDANGFLARLAIGSDGQVLTSTGTLPNWEAAGAGGSFSGPGSSTDNAVVRFNGTGGATGQNSGVIIDDSNNVTGAANVTLSGELDAATGDFSGDVDIDGTTNLDAVDIDGAVQIDSTVTVGVDDTGHDVKFFGATSGKYLEWDESADQLNVLGTAFVNSGATRPIAEFTSSHTNRMIVVSADTETADDTVGIAFNATASSAIGSTHSIAAIEGKVTQAGTLKGDLIFHVNAGDSYTERMRIHSDGLLRVVGTAASPSSADGAAGVAYFTGAASDSGIAVGSYASSPWDNWIQSQQENGTVSDIVMQPRGGMVGIGGVPTVPFHIFSAVGGDVVQWEQTNTSGSFLRFRYNGITPDNNTVHFLHGSDGTANRVYIYSDGDLANHDGTYGTISDVKLKQDITDVRSYWDDFKSLQYRKFRHKTDVEADADAPYRLGLVAQEVETVFPTLAPESPDPDIETQEAVVDDDGVAVLDDDGNPTYETVSTPSGTTHKWVKSSIIEGPIMGSVVQELQTRLEAAEAKIAALESA